MRVAILTISDAGHRGERDDTSGDAIAAWIAERGCTLAARALVPDETGAIVRALIGWADGDQADLMLTTGGTGLTPRDVTPEATRAVLDKEAPGIAEALRMSVLSPVPPRGALARPGGGARPHAHRQPARQHRRRERRARRAGADRGPRGGAGARTSGPATSSGPPPATASSGGWSFRRPASLRCPSSKPDSSWLRRRC